jgi:hypothetical protein
MLAKRKWRLVSVVLAVACMVPSLSAVIVEIREYHGKQVSCIHSGLRGVAKQCGTEGYECVFTGFVRSSVEVGDTDKLLQLVPDEAFVGDSVCDSSLFVVRATATILPSSSAPGPISALMGLGR